MMTKKFIYLLLVVSIFYGCSEKDYDGIIYYKLSSYTSYFKEKRFYAYYFKTGKFDTLYLDDCNPSIFEKTKLYFGLDLADGFDFMFKDNLMHLDIDHIKYLEILDVKYDINKEMYIYDFLIKTHSGHEFQLKVESFTIYEIFAEFYDNKTHTYRLGIEQFNSPYIASNTISGEPIIIPLIEKILFEKTPLIRSRYVKSIIPKDDTTGLFE